jgi:hypothetical protein
VNGSKKATDTCNLHMQREQEVQQKAQYFAKPHRVFSALEVSTDPMIVPGAKGIYGWYFDGLPRVIPVVNCVTVHGYVLLYVGIAGVTPGSRSTLRKRICSNHLGRHSTPQSTLRRTLGALLRDQLQLVRYPKAGRRYWFGREGEARLRQWIVDHALLTWQEDDNPKEIETAILSDAGSVLPLNKVH